MSKSAAELYERDFVEWTLHNAELLREGPVAEADIAHIAEEIEDMGRRDRREVFSRMQVLLLHLLNWKFQPERCGTSQGSWMATIREQRNQLYTVMLDSPSLRRYASENIGAAYERARFDAGEETGAGSGLFPAECPWTLDHILDRAFLPE